MTDPLVVTADLNYNAGSNGRLTISRAGRLRVEALAADASGPQSVSRLPSSAGSTNATSVKSSAGKLFRVSGFNANAAARYLKLYNKATAPVPGTDVPFWTEYLPAQAKFSVGSNSPLIFAAGIGFALTTAVADADTGAVTAGDILGLNVAYS